MGCLLKTQNTIFFNGSTIQYSQILLVNKHITSVNSQKKLFQDTLHVEYVETIPFNLQRTNIPP